MRLSGGVLVGGHKDVGHAHKIGPGDTVFQPRQGRLTGQVWAGEGQALTGRLEARVDPQRVGVVGIFIATGDLIHPLADQILHGMIYVARMTAVPHRTHQTTDDADPRFDHAQKQGAAVAGHRAALEIGLDFPALYVGEPQHVLAIFLHGSFLFIVGW